MLTVLPWIIFVLLCIAYRTKIVASFKIALIITRVLWSFVVTKWQKVTGFSVKTTRDVTKSKTESTLIRVAGNLSLIGPKSTKINIAYTDTNIDVTSAIRVMREFSWKLEGVDTDKKASVLYVENTRGKVQVLKIKPDGNVEF